MLCILINSALMRHPNSFISVFFLFLGLFLVIFWFCRCMVVFALITLLLPQVASAKIKSVKSSIRQPRLNKMVVLIGYVLVCRIIYDEKMH